MFRSVILIFVLPLLFSSCKRDIAGCNDIEATNWSSNANLNDGSCNYKPLIMNSSFESGDGYWSTYTGNGFSPYANVTNVGDGFMPTSGRNFLKCVPKMNYINGTRTNQYVGSNKHYKGFYFDYSYTAIGGADSIVLAYVAVGSIFGQINPINWIKNISETPSSYGGFPSITVRKRDEYVELPYSDQTGVIGIITNVSKGTFTFQIDNIREVPR